MFRPTPLVFAVSLALVGCNFAGKEVSDADDANNPHYKAAQGAIDNNDAQGAVADYEAALAHNPKLAGAHYKLGLIYGDKLNDPVSSIYHLRRYLELAPNSDKDAEVKGMIDKQGGAFATSLPNSTDHGSADVTQLQGENAALKKQVDDATRTIAQLQGRLAGKHRGRYAMQSPPPLAEGPAPVIPVSTAAADAPATNATPAEPPKATPVDTNAPDVNAPAMAAPGGTNAAAAPAGPSKSYTVVKGDKIWKIAKKNYPGDTKNGVDKILAANPGLDPKKLKIGQVLVIPQ